MVNKEELATKWLARNMKRYGLSMERYLEILEDQKNLCAICGKPEKADNQSR